MNLQLVLFAIEETQEMSAGTVLASRVADMQFQDGNGNDILNSARITDGSGVTFTGEETLTITLPEPVEIRKILLGMLDATSSLVQSVELWAYVKNANGEEVKYQHLEKTLVDQGLQFYHQSIDLEKSDRALPFTDKIDIVLFTDSGSEVNGVLVDLVVRTRLSYTPVFEKEEKLQYKSNQYDSSGAILTQSSLYNFILPEYRSNVPQCPVKGVALHESSSSLSTSDLSLSLYNSSWVETHTSSDMGTVIKFAIDVYHQDI